MGRDPNGRGLTAQQVPSATPEQRVSKASEAHKGKEQPQAQGHDQTAPGPLSSTPQPTAPASDEARQYSGENLHIQRWLMYFTGALAVFALLQVGSMFWQAILLRHTRADVKRQADWMETQAGHMASQVGLMQQQLVEIKSGGETARMSADAATSSADAANAQIQVMKDRERARLQIELEDFVFKSDTTWLLMQDIKWKITLHGQTEASDVKAECVACIGDPLQGSNLHILSTPMKLPSILSPSQREYSGVAHPSPFSTSKVEVGLWTADDLIAGRGELYFSGWIEFRDVFGDRWALPFYRKWVYVHHERPEVEAIVRGKGFWSKHGNNEENRKA